MSQERPEITVIVPISERHEDITKLYRLYARELKQMGRLFEFLFVIDGDFPLAHNELKKLKAENHPIRIIKFPRNFGESTALMEGFRQAKGSKILTLASYMQIEPTELQKVFSAYEDGYDLVITRRYPRKDPFINRIQAAIYHFFIRKLTGVTFKDVTSGMRLINKKILSEFVLYGDLHRFIPVFAIQRGIKVREVKVAQRREDTSLRLLKPGIYLRRFIDILTVFFLVKFTKKPLRFFGLIGSAFLISGLLISCYLTALKIFGAIALSNRPLLLLGLVLMVFGIQIFSVGLVAELIIFNNAKYMKGYSIEQIYKNE